MPDSNDHSISWWITKRTPTFTVSENSVTLQDLDGLRSSTVTVNRQGNGAISAFSDDINVASAYVSGTNVTVTRQGKGNANIYVMLGSYTTTFTLNHGYIWADGDNSDSYQLKWQIAKANCNVATKQITNVTTYRIGSTCVFEVTRTGNGDISFTAVDKAKFSITKTENITNGKRFTVLWNQTGTTRITATVAATDNYNTGYQPLSYSVKGREPTFSIGNFEVTALSEVKRRYTTNSPGNITFSAFSYYIDTRVEKNNYLVVSGKKIGKVTVTASIAASGEYDSGSFTFEVTVNGAIRSFNCISEFSTPFLIENSALPSVEPISNISGSYGIKDVTCDNTGIIEYPGVFGYSIDFVAVKPGKAKIDFTVYDPDNVYAEVIYSSYVYVTKRDRVVTLNLPDDGLNVTMYRHKSFSVDYEDDGAINVSGIGLKISTSGKTITYSGTSTGVKSLELSIPANDYYNAYSYSLSINILENTRPNYKLYYTYNCNTAKEKLNYSDLINFDRADITVNFPNAQQFNQSVRIWLFLFDDNDNEIERLQPYVEVTNNVMGSSQKAGNSDYKSLTASGNIITLHSNAGGLWVDHTGKISIESYPNYCNKIYKKDIKVIVSRAAV